MLDLIHKHKDQFRISYSISGALLEQLCVYAPEVVDGFRQLAATGCVEVLVQPHDHSLSFLYSSEEFIEQVKTHKQIIHDLFGQTPRVLCNTELLCHHQMAKWIEQLGGFKMLLIDGACSVWLPGSRFRLSPAGSKS
jgi:alpha-amylase